MGSKCLLKDYWGRLANISIGFGFKVRNGLRQFCLGLKARVGLGVHRPKAKNDRASKEIFESKFLFWAEEF